MTHTNAELSTNVPGRRSSLLLKGPLGMCGSGISAVKEEVMQLRIAIPRRGARRSLRRPPPLMLRIIPLHFGLQFAEYGCGLSGVAREQYRGEPASTGPRVRASDGVGGRH